MCHLDYDLASYWACSISQEQICALIKKATFSSLEKSLPNETNLYSYNGGIDHVNNGINPETSTISAN